MTALKLFYILCLFLGVATRLTFATVDSKTTLNSDNSSLQVITEKDNLGQVISIKDISRAPDGTIKQVVYATQTGPIRQTLTLNIIGSNIVYSNVSVSASAAGVRTENITSVTIDGVTTIYNSTNVNEDGKQYAYLSQKAGILTYSVPDMLDYPAISNVSITPTFSATLTSTVTSSTTTVYTSTNTATTTVANNAAIFETPSVIVVNNFAPIGPSYGAIDTVEPVVTKSFEFSQNARPYFLASSECQSLGKSFADVRQSDCAAIQSTAASRNMSGPVYIKSYTSSNGVIFNSTLEKAYALVFSQSFQSFSLQAITETSTCENILCV